MPNIKFLKNPGFLYDLNYLFYLKFNKELCIESVEKARRDEAKAYFTHISTLFGEISDDLFVFYHAIENGYSFVFTYYLDAFKDRFTTDFSISVFRHALSDTEKLKKNMIRFYLRKLKESEVIECLASSSLLFDYIKNSSYSDSEKCKLYEFFLNPVFHQQMLLTALSEKEVQLSTYYKENYDMILNAHNHVTVHTLSNFLGSIVDLSSLNDHENDMYVSICLIHRYLVLCFLTSNGIVCPLGYDYTLGMNAHLERIKTPPLDAMCSALSEKSRIQILEYLLKKGEATCKDLEKIFDFSGSTAYHHVSMLAKIGAVKVRNEGKTIFYSINKSFFDTVRNLLTKFSNN